MIPRKKIDKMPKKFREVFWKKEHTEIEQLLIQSLKKAKQLPKEEK